MGNQSRESGNVSFVRLFAGTFYYCVKELLEFYSTAAQGNEHEKLHGMVPRFSSALFMNHAYRVFLPRQHRTPLFAVRCASVYSDLATTRVDCLAAMLN